MGRVLAGSMLSQESRHRFQGAEITNVNNKCDQRPGCGHALMWCCAYLGSSTGLKRLWAANVVLFFLAIGAPAQTEKSTANEADTALITVQNYKSLAEKGHPWAMYQLAYCYASGKGV